MNIFKNLNTASLLVAGLFLAPGCASDDGDNNDGPGDECTGAKCDTPSGEQDEQCKDRQSEVLASTNQAFTMNAIRWACADVEGVTAANRDDRGQEYCEYFALFQPPPADEEDPDAEEAPARPDAVDLGRPLNRDGDVSNLTVCVDLDGDGADDDGRGADVCRTTLNEVQFEYLQDNPTEVLGQCVFTSWHSDISTPVVNCQGEGGKEECGENARIYNFPFTVENFRMKISSTSRIATGARPCSRSRSFSRSRLS